MDFVILDLEWNAAYSRRLRGYINEIIEFGAVKCGPDLKKKDSFSCFVKPQVGKHVNAIVSDLTSITDENLTDGLSFMQAASRFKKWAGDCVIMTWGTSDVLTLIENCRYFSGNEEVPFLSRYCDLQRYAQIVMELGTSEQVGLEKAAELLGLDLSGRSLHRAVDDSAVTLEILQKVYDAREIQPFLQQCDEEFYRRMTFRTSYICDLKSPLVRKSHLLFSCPKCGGESRRTSGWILKNRGFRAEFLCKNCGYPFAGRLTMKLKYEGLSVNKKTYPVPIIEAPRQTPLPGPLGNMRLELTESGAGVLRFPAWERFSWVNAAFTTRLGGVSEGEFAALNLGFGRGDDEEKVAENYRIFCKAAGFDPDSLVTGNQDHHTNILRVTAEHRGLGIWTPKLEESIDGLCTDDPAVTLVVYCADCVPLYFVDERHHAIGLAHAGWRGTAAGMAKAMVERMAAQFGSRPEEIYAAVGPSICQDCFEVDEPVAAEFLALPHAGAFVKGPVDTGGEEATGSEDNRSRPQKYYVNLWECNRQFLLEAGVLPEHIALGNVCTMCESDLIFSHRKTRGRRGSNAAFLALK